MSMLIRNRKLIHSKNGCNKKLNLYWNGFLIHLIGLNQFNIQCMLKKWRKRRKSGFLLSRDCWMSSLF